MSRGPHDLREEAESVQMLRAVLDGESYHTVGSRHGVTRSTVERRVKHLAEHLLHTVGIDGVSLGAVGFVRRLRLHREAVAAALRRAAPTQASSAVAPLCRHGLQQATDRLLACAAHRAHDLALFHLLFSTGMRPLELARLTVGDCVSPTGAILRVGELRADITQNGQPRPLLLNSPRVVEALSAYLAERLRRGHGLGADACYGGLCPDSPLFLNPAGQSYRLQVDTRAGKPRHRCRGMQEALRKVFRDAGLPLLSSRDARLTVIALLYARGADEAQVGLLLGIRDNSAVRALLPRPRPPLAELTQDLY